MCRSSSDVAFSMRADACVSGEGVAGLAGRMRLRGGDGVAGGEWVSGEAADRACMSVEPGSAGRVDPGARLRRRWGDMVVGAGDA